MSIRPIDIQTGVARVADSTRVNNETNVRTGEQQQMFSQKFERQVELEATQVIQTEKAEYAKVDRDGKNKQEKESKKKKKDDKSDKSNKHSAAVSKNKNSTSMYDISI